MRRIEQLVEALREDAGWAAMNEWETPITLSDHLGEAADMLEKLAAENERLRSRSEAAENDMAAAQGLACRICRHHVPCVDGRKYTCDASGYDEALICGRFEWRGPQKELGAE